MPYTWMPGKHQKKHKTHGNLMTPVDNILPDITPLLSRCNRPLQMSFEDQLNILVYFHLEEHRSGRHLLQVIKEEHFARQYIAPVNGIEKSSFFEDIGSRGLEQMMEMFQSRCKMQGAKTKKEKEEIFKEILERSGATEAVISHEDPASA